MLCLNVGLNLWMISGWLHLIPYSWIRTRALNCTYPHSACWAPGICIGRGGCYWVGFSGSAGRRNSHPIGREHPRAWCWAPADPRSRQLWVYPSLPCFLFTIPVLDCTKQQQQYGYWDSTKNGSLFAITITWMGFATHQNHFVIKYSSNGSK